MCKSPGKHSEGACVHGQKKSTKWALGVNPPSAQQSPQGSLKCTYISVKFDTVVASVANFLVQEWRNVSNDTPEGTVLVGHFPLQYCDYIVEMYFYLPLLDFLLEE